MADPVGHLSVLLKAGICNLGYVSALTSYFTIHFVHDSIICLLVREGNGNPEFQILMLQRVYLKIAVRLFYKYCNIFINILNIIDIKKERKTSILN